MLVIRLFSPKSTLRKIEVEQPLDSTTSAAAMTARVSLDNMHSPFLYSLNSKDKAVKSLTYLYAIDHEQ